MKLLRDRNNKFTFFTTLLMLAMFSVSCLPEQQRVFNPNTAANTTTTTDDNDSNSNTTTTNVLPETVNFLQQGTVKETATLSMFADFNDTFLIRGNEVNSYLQGLSDPFNSKFCLATKFTGTSGSNVKEVLILAARVRSFINYSIGGNEFYFQLDVSNESINTSDCMTSELAAVLAAEYSSTNFSLSIAKTCPDCSTTINSGEMKLYMASGQEDKNVNISSLRIAIIPALGSTTSESVTCSSNANCASLGYNCCFNGQCVNHGAVKEDVDTSSDEYLIATQKILARPELIINYQDIFYICPLMVPTNPDNSQEDPNLDPVQQAADQFEELQDIYRCLNPQLDEYAICTKEYTGASELITSSGYSFSAEVDDLTFKDINTGITFNNIHEVTYGGKILYQEDFYNTAPTVPWDTDDGSFQTGSNDDFVIGQQALIKADLPTDAVNDTVKIRYLVDGTCERLGASLARCTKYYTQGQGSTPGRPSDHTAGSSLFLLPDYANLSYNLVVEVGGVKVAPSSTTWEVTTNGVRFDATNYPIYNNQQLSITYFVTSQVDLLMTSKDRAQEKVNTYCACDPNYPCNLEPVKETINNTETIVNYICKYTQPDLPEPPLRETVYISAKTAPHKFYDTNGVYYKNENISNGDVQEGTHFEYDNGNNLKPNNISNYIGFNEIYGTFNQNEASAMPATVIEVVKGRRYDLWTEAGVFSNCLNCGTDYYSNLTKVFPGEFLHKGGGYLPDLVESRRIRTQSDFRPDDLLFGRGCFVPATMIPWTHSKDEDVSTQRRNRLAAQHFLFANGYNRDWYGFDYGSIIGSFDGVKWFSVGSARRVQATSDRLYLAMNAYFGDLTTNNTYKIMINETTAQLYNGTVVDPDKYSILYHDPNTVIGSDLDSFGAQCQRFHLCDTDNDCLTRLGYDYVCANVGTLRTKWPTFDDYGREISGETDISMLSLVGGSNGFVKRCVYRGKGAPCEIDSHNITDSSQSYAQSMNAALNLCSPNNYCEELTEEKFNTKIARYGDSPNNQNNKSYVTPKTDTFGLSTRFLGRPLKYYGDEEVPTAVKDQFDLTGVDAICIPGKDVENVTMIEELNSQMGGGERKSDKVLNMGMTKGTVGFQDTNYFTGCPAVDNDEDGTGEYTYRTPGSLTSALHYRKTIAQNMSTNSLNLTIFDELDFFNDDDGSTIDKIGYHKNTCLRAPGASCFTDLDCSANEWVTTKVKTITDFDTLNEPEQKFWQEELVCANTQLRYQESSTYINDQYDLRTHRCCMETGNDFSFYSQTHEDSEFNMIDTSGNLLVPGVNQDINDETRYSRVHTIYDKVVEDSATYPAPLVPKANPTTPMTQANFKLRQYNTIHLHNSRMCCTGHWVRNFAKSTDANGGHGNGGGHRFKPERQQSFNDIGIFKTLSWGVFETPPGVNGLNNQVPYACDGTDADTQFCEIRNISSDNDRDLSMLRWFAKFELLGIPQVLIETDEVVFKPLDEAGQTAATTKEVFDGTILPVGTTGNHTDVAAAVDVNFAKNQLGDGLLEPNMTAVDVRDESSLEDESNLTNIPMYSAGNMNNFDLGGDQGFKQIFSADTFNCCVPTGYVVEDHVDSNDCCTGLVTNTSIGRVCCLEDYTDLSVYTNRFVSSEGAKFQGFEISDDEIDPVTGYISRELVLQMGATMCCSGEAAYGTAIADLFIPLIDTNGEANGTDPLYMSRRWLYKSGMDGASDVGNVVPYFNAGLRWNNHVYCVPSGYNDGGGGGSSSSGGSTSGSSGSSQ
jgi:hypothetical protein